MFKKFFICFLLSMITSNFIYAQPISFSAPSSLRNKNLASTAMSPDEYRKRVGQLNQQNQQTLQKEVKEELSKVPKPILPPITGAPQQPYTGPPTTPTPPPAPTQPSFAPTPTSQPYTGFQGTAPNNNNTNRPQPKGWNIKY